MPFFATALRMSEPAPAGNGMTLVFDTSLEAGEQITLPLRGTVNCTVNWGDSTSDAYTTTGDKTHTYSVGGTYTVSITGTLTGFNSGVSTVPNGAKLTQVTSFGAIGLANMRGAFNGCANLTVAPDTLPSTITDTSLMFFNDTSFNHDVGGWDTGNVTNMDTMFANCTTFNRNLGSWNVSNVTDLQSIFSGCTAYQGAGISAWDLSGLNSVNSLTNFALNCTFSTANYDALLVAWEAAKAGYRSDLSPHFGASTYTSGGAAATARAALVTYGWTITDGGTA